MGVATKIIATLLLASFAGSASANSKRDLSGFTVHLGEAFSPVNYRFTHGGYDFGLTRVPALMLYAGSRNWFGNGYVGYGVGGGDGVGFYGSIGWEGCAVLCIGAEFIGGGDSSGVSNAYATVSTGVAW